MCANRVGSRSRGGGGVAVVVVVFVVVVVAVGSTLVLPEEELTCFEEPSAGILARIAPRSVEQRTLPFMRTVHTLAGWAGWGGWLVRLELGVGGCQVVGTYRISYVARPLRCGRGLDFC